MSKLFWTLFLMLISALPAFTLANSLERYDFDSTFFSGSYSPENYETADIYFNQIGNDFWWKIFFQDLKMVELTQLEIVWYAQRDCMKQVRWFYLNSARGNRVRPLDGDSLNYLKSVDSSYDNLTMTGGLFVCSSPSNGVVWYIQHVWSGELFSLVAWLEYDFLHNDYLPSFAPNGNFLFENGIATGYLWDSYGGIAQIIWSGLDVQYVCDNGFVEDNEVCDGTSNGLVPGWCNDHCDWYVTNICGNSVTENPETCDDGNINSWDGCSSLCQIESSPPPSGWWDRLWPTLKPDVCPDHRDCSDNYYDLVCWPCVSTGISVDSPILLSWSIGDSPFSQELNEAYLRAYSVGITTMPTIQRANMTWTLIRKHAAKMISEFAIKVLGKKPDTTRSCVFSDIAETSEEMKFYMKISCQLGLMGLNADGTPNTFFTPDGQVTRAQFGTMLSRLLYGNLNNGKPGQRYEAHLNALKAAGIMNKITFPEMLEMRGRVMLMMMRIDQPSWSSELSWDEVSFEGFIDDTLSTWSNYVAIKWILSIYDVASIVVSHTDSSWPGKYTNYSLQKFRPGDTTFVFYAYTDYASLTLKDINTYVIQFFDKEWTLLFTKSLSIVQK